MPIEPNSLYNDDCLNIMPQLPEKSINLILADLPYGITAAKWDSIIPLDQMWANFNRILKDNGKVVLTASQPFTSMLIMSNPKMFKYEWIWVKNNPSGHLNAKKQPMKAHETILVFSNKSGIYNPQFSNEKQSRYGKVVKRNYSNVCLYGKSNVNTQCKCINEYKYPTTILKANVATRGKNQLHPTQKPLDLMEYLIKTYTNEGDVVFDPTMGSGTTGVAAIGLNRQFIGIEKDEHFFQVAKERLNKTIGENNYKTYA